jgi:hypothetical protein
MDRLRRWFVGHWFGGVFAIIGGLWLITTVAYALGMGGVSFGNRYTGQTARIDFGREHDHTVLELGDGVGLSLDGGAGGVRGSVIRVRAGLPVLCWVCGNLDSAGGIGRVERRRGDWFFRAPSDESRNSEALHGRAESRAFILTLAYNRATGERVQVEPSTAIADQAALLAARGLDGRDDATRLSAKAVADLPELSMQREGCVIVQLAFVGVAILWTVLGGLALAIAWMVRRGRRRAR